jgi:hypothetical protein
VKVEPAVLGKSEKDLEADVSSMIEERLRLHNMNTNRRQDRQQFCGSGMFIPDPIFSIPDPNFSHPGSDFFPSRILDLYHRNLSIFLTQKKIVSKHSEL